MTPIYNADTLREVSTTARLAEFTHIQDKYVPQALCKVNEMNFSAANEGRNHSTITFNLPSMGLTTQDAQDYFRIGLKTELESLGITVNILIIHGGRIQITCKW